ncbi:MAG: Sapep family Mn(2+)-dependent dipeptidase [Firmicutes bacterium]|nr:Sapep family Mn(2+)-dependent dipeptidase [Bacillota bacterium]
MFGERILAYWDDIARDLATVVAIPSVSVPTEGEYPFGKACADVLDKAVELAQSYGFTAKNVDYYAAHAEYGEGEENAVIMGHLDVVPAGDGWDSDPFTMIEKDGYYWGRGVADNKGPSIIALHCLRALKDAGIVPKRKIRVVFGAAEEIGMADMEHYFSKEQHPTMGFTPDGGYGICHCEKGLMRFKVTGAASPIIRTFQAGTVVNAVPYKAEADIICTPQEAAACQELAVKGAFECTPIEGGLHILSKGKAAHAAGPGNGINAASHLIELLYDVFGDRLGTLFSWIHASIGLTYDGSLYGVACSDEVSGPLTFNLGLVDSTSFTVDIRYPATLDGKKISATLKDKTEDAGLNFILLSDDAPLYLPKDSKLVQLLSGAYQDITGEECSIYSMGGGTYARQMFGNGVAFGAGFPGFPSNAHDRNECTNIEKLKLHAQICLEAMYRLATMD